MKVLNLYKEALGCGLKDFNYFVVINSLMTVEKLNL